MKQKIQTKLSKIRNKLFSTRKMKIVSVLIFLAVGGAIFFSANYFAKGATYGWLQATWSGGADESAVADHTNNQTLWTKFFSKDTNVVAGETLTLSAGTSNVTDTTTVQFDAGTNTNGTTLPVTHSEDEVKLNLGYDATGICGNFYVLPLDRGGTTSTTANWATAMSYCDSLCSTCNLPTSEELVCICQHKVASFGNNFVVDGYYWSATQNYSSYASDVHFSYCAAGDHYQSYAFYVRCVRR